MLTPEERIEFERLGHRGGDGAVAQHAIAQGDIERTGVGNAVIAADHVRFAVRRVVPTNFRFRSRR